jgi:hypothetical protein
MHNSSSSQNNSRPSTPEPQPSTPRGPENRIQTPDPFAGQNAPIRPNLIAQPSLTVTPQQTTQEYFDNRARNLGIENPIKGGRG